MELARLMYGYRCVFVVDELCIHTNFVEEHCVQCTYTMYFILTHQEKGSVLLVYLKQSVESHMGLVCQRTRDFGMRFVLLKCNTKFVLSH